MNSGLPVQITPFGGVGKIGGNLTLFQFAQVKIVIDCGLLFPENDYFGLQYLVPDISSINEIDALILTHAHEDHIGAYAYLLSKIKVKNIYATSFAKSVLEKKLGERLPSKITLIQPNQKIFLEQVMILPFLVAHSTVDTLAVLLSSDAADFSCLFASDYKFKDNSEISLSPVWEEAKLKFQKTKKNVLFLDSTCAHRTGFTPAENELKPVLQKIFDQATKKIFITFFPSNIERLKNIIELAHQNQLKVTALGRSVNDFLQIAIEEKFIPNSAPIFIDSEDYKPARHGEKIIVLVSGCQGDRYSAFRRFALGQFDHFNPTSDDLFIYSARIIPGNETAVFSVFNLLSEKNIRIISPDEELVHTSGHGQQEDLAKFVSFFNPSAMVPIHGEFYHLRSSQKFFAARFPKLEVFFLKNFSTLIYDGANFKIQELEAPSPLPILENGQELISSAFTERKKMAQRGLCTIFISTKREYDITFSLCGINPTKESDLDHLKAKIIKKLASTFKKSSINLLEEEIIRETKSFFKQKLASPPLIKVCFQVETK